MSMPGIRVEYCIHCLRKRVERPKVKVCAVAPGGRHEWTWMVIAG